MHDTLTVALILLVVVGLVMPVGTSTAAAASGEVPEPLEDGYYYHDEIETGTTVSYDAELTAGDTLLVVAVFDPAHDFEVSITDPSGDSVGMTFGDDDHYGVELREAGIDGTYTVEITNHGEAASFDLDVVHEDGEPDEVPDPLEPGHYTGQSLDAGESVSYGAELTTGDFFVAGTSFGPEADLEVTITDPEGDEVGIHETGDSHHYVELHEAAHDGTYRVTITNPGEATDFDFEVIHETHEGFEPDTVPEPLEEGRYSDQTLDAGETVSYAAELTAGDLFVAGTSFPSDDDLEVTITDPEGNEVGYHDVGDSYHYVELREAARDGTYLVTIANEGDATHYQLEVQHETRSEPEPDTVPEPLETGYYTNLEIGPGETLTYHAEVATGDLLNAWAWSDGVDLDVRIIGPDGTPVGIDLSDEMASGAGVVGASTDGTYTVEVTNTDDRSATFDLNTFHETPTELGDGTYEGGLEPEEFDLYAIDLTTADELSIEFDFENPDSIDFVLIDPELEAVEDFEWDGDADRIEFSDVETGGTYVLQLINIGGEPASYGFEVAHDRPGGTGADDGDDGVDLDDDDVDTPDEDGVNSDDDDVDTPDEDGVDSDDSVDDPDEDAAASDDETTDSENDSADGDTDDATDGDGTPGMGTMTAFVALTAVAMIALARARTDANQ